MKTVKLFLLLLFTGGFIYCQNAKNIISSDKVRKFKDTIGFATKADQMDGIMKRLRSEYLLAYYDSLYTEQKINSDLVLRMAICPHDDYAYAGFIYNEVFSLIKAKAVIIFGVAHKAKKFNIEEKIVFDDFKYWHGPYGDIKVSPLREQLIKNLSPSDYIVHDSLQIEEHSVEAFLPFLQYYNREVEIISVLVPYMSATTTDRISEDFALALQKAMKKNNLEWGRDVAILISSDAVHYGDEDWGGKTYASFGCDSAGYKRAISYEKEIITQSLSVADSVSAMKFIYYTLQSNDWREYKWTWCGRYSIPFGLLTAYHLQKLSGEAPLKSVLSDYSTSIAQKPIKVDDLKMGLTAPANLHHWVGYCVAGFK